MSDTTIDPIPHIDSDTCSGAYHDVFDMFVEDSFNDYEERYYNPFYNEYYNAPYRNNAYY